MTNLRLVSCNLLPVPVTCFVFLCVFSSVNVERLRLSITLLLFFFFFSVGKYYFQDVICKFELRFLRALLE